MKETNDQRLAFNAEFNVISNVREIGKESFNRILELVNKIKEYNLNKVANGDLENAYFMEEYIDKEQLKFFNIVREMTPQNKLYLASYLYTLNKDFLKKFWLQKGQNTPYFAEDIENTWFYKVFVTLYLL